jgi:hypothetical protein
MWRAVLALLALSSAGCSQTRDVPVAELPRLVSEIRSGREVEVVSVDGKRVRIESFSRVEVWRREGCWKGSCSMTRLLKLEQPFEARLLPEGVELSGLDGRKKRQRVVQLVPLDQRRTWARLLERSRSRGLTAGGVAVASALAVGISVGAIVRAKSDDPHGLTPMLAGMFAGYAAGGLSLLITLPLTKPLGTEL